MLLLHHTNPEIPGIGDQGASHFEVFHRQITLWLLRN